MEGAENKEEIQEQQVVNTQPPTTQENAAQQEPPIRTLDEILGNTASAQPVPPEPKKEEEKVEIPYYKNLGFENEEALKNTIELSRAFSNMPKEVVAAFNASEEKSFDVFLAKVQEIQSLRNEVKVDETFDINSESARELYKTGLKRQMGALYSETDAEDMYDDLLINKKESEVKFELLKYANEINSERQTKLTEYLKNGEIRLPEQNTSAPVLTAEQIAEKEAEVTRLLSESEQGIKQIIAAENYSFIADYGDSKVSVYQPNEQQRSIVEAAYMGLLEPHIKSGASVSPETQREFLQIAESVCVRLELANIIADATQKRDAYWEAKLANKEQERIAEERARLGMGNNATRTQPPVNADKQVSKPFVVNGIDLSKR